MRRDERARGPRRSRRAPKKEQRKGTPERAPQAQAAACGKNERKAERKRYDARNLVVGTAGHIDHGKSALVQALTGIDPDRLKEEKARGITIELGFAHTDDRRHRASRSSTCPATSASCKHMLAGVGGIDCVLLVVAADESVMPQTREHFDICRLLHVPRGIVVLTKSDLVDADTLELVAAGGRASSSPGSFLEAAPIVPCRRAPATASTRCATRSLVAGRRRCGTRPADGAARLPIDRVFSMKGFGTVVTGTLVVGTHRASTTS